LRGVVLGTSRTARQGGIAEGEGPERASVGRTSHKQTRRLTQRLPKSTLFGRELADSSYNTSIQPLPSNSSTTLLTFCA